MEDITLALITLTSFVLLFVVAIFADRAGMQADQTATEPVLVPVDDPKSFAADERQHRTSTHPVDVDVA